MLIIIINIFARPQIGQTGQIIIISILSIKLNDDTLTDDNEMQRLNISPKVVKEEHPLKIPLISVIFCALNDDKLSEVKERHPQNIPPISVTLCVLNDFKSNDFNLEQSQNI